MDISSLELALSQYNAQLTQIRNLLSSADALTKLELYDLEKDLTEMIQLTESQLLSAKKEELLCKLDEANSNENGTDERPPLVRKGDSDSCLMPDTSNNSFDDMQLDLIGVKCRVKYTQDWGSYQYHNAMILSCDLDDALENEVVKVCVLFLNPIHISMVPCKYFLDGTCNYDDECQYSHGYLVNLDEVEEYEEPDFTHLRNGSKCIAKFEENGVWYPAVIDEIHEDQVTISFDTYNETLTVTFDSILPIHSSEYDDNGSSSEEDDSVNVNDENYVSYKPASMSGKFGEWEEHTKGFGSKLMTKMGYIFGKGLGKNGEGRVEPVEIKLLPAGKSLDYIAEMREKGMLRDPTKKKHKSDKYETLRKGTPESACKIINKLTRREPETGDHREFSEQSFSIEDSYRSLKRHLKYRRTNNLKSRPKQKDTKLNIEMFKVSEKMKSLKKKLTLQKESLARNMGDGNLSTQIKQNIVAIEIEIDELRTIDQSLQKKLLMKNQSKKLSVF